MRAGKKRRQQLTHDNHRVLQRVHDAAGPREGRVVGVVDRVDVFAEKGDSVHHAVLWRGERWGGGKGGRKGRK